MADRPENRSWVTVPVLVTVVVLFGTGNHRHGEVDSGLWWIVVPLDCLVIEQGFYQQTR